MKKFSLIALLLVSSLLMMGNMGCDKAKEAKDKANDIAGKVTVTANGVTFAVNAADPIVAKLEELSGAKLNPEIAEKGANFMKKAETGLTTTAKFTKFIPGGEAITAAVLALGALAGGIGTLLENRKGKKIKEALKTVIKAVEPVKDIGKIITTATIAEGNADLVESAFKEVVNG